MEKLVVPAIHGISMPAMSDLEWAQRRCDILNSRRVDGHGYNCNLCGNKEYIHQVREDGEIVAVPCKCKGPRDSLRRLRRSGLEQVIRNCTLDKFQASEQWQKDMLMMARDFLQKGGVGWLYIGGQVGCGKSHLCTGIVRELLLQGKEARYMAWRDASEALKAQLNTPEYQQTMEDLKSVEVLYIDDLFKSGKEPTARDINIAFELLNHRYLDRRLITIISSEYDVETLLRIDQAVGSRIYERSRGHYMVVDKDNRRNYRMWRDKDDGAIQNSIS